jgi:hypothetical protein
LTRVRRVTPTIRAGRARALLTTLCAVAALQAATSRAEIVVDGHIDEPEWQHAVSCGDWQRTLPFALDAARYGNDARFLSTQNGLAVAFVIEQPPAERRVRPRTPRDAASQTGDSVTVMLDLDGTGQVGYEFAVALGGGVRDGLITNQNRFDRDWDGEWQHAVAESDDRWSVELFIPWSTVSMRKAHDATRSIGVYATRYLAQRDERYACPGISQDSPGFLGDFRRIEISQYESPGQLDIVPYGTAISDFLEEDTELKAGVDVNWKISPSVALAATLNPDFGQVESDELVVDFSAIETVFTDKRPFFTENQGIFDLRTPANGQLIYTRRIGAAPDDGSAGSSDIDAAAKLTGTAGSVVYGAFAAQEDGYSDDVGRFFAAGRVLLPLSAVRVGYLGTWTDRPFLDRDAIVNAMDYEITPSDEWRIAGQFIRSDVEAAADTTTGYESWLQVDLNRSAPLTHTIKFLHIDDRFELDDLGYMERNSLEQVEWETNRRVASVGEGARINGETQRLYMFYRENTDGDRLQSRVQVSRDVQYVSSWRSYYELRYITSGVDDLISRGNGPVQLDERGGAYFDVSSPRYERWQYGFGAYLFQQGVSDYSAYAQFFASWYPTEKLTLRLDLIPEYSDDWLLWETGNLFGSYRSSRLDYDFRLDWIPAARHELRVKWQWIGVDASPRQAYRTDAGGNLVASADTIAPFTVSNLGLQIRYRYEIGPQSELFLVYGRGGFDLLRDDDRDLPQLFRDMTEVRDADQFLVKVRYRL